MGLAKQRMQQIRLRDTCVHPCRRSLICRAYRVFCAKNGTVGQNVYLENVAGKTPLPKFELWIVKIEITKG